MRLDTQQALRPVVCLPNPSALHGARWERLDTEQALRPVIFAHGEMSFLHP